MLECDVVVDMQFGSTGKGSAVVQLVSERIYDASVRVQSIQAGHTIYYEDKPYKMRTIPCAWVDPDVKLILGAGCFIDKELLLEEIKMITDATGKDPRDRLYVDFRAFYVIAEDVTAEMDLEGKMGSTAHGAGASLIRKMWRRSAPTRVIDDNWATNNGIKIVDTIELLYEQESVLVEGCQGAMLSIHTSPYYPFVTSREATVSGIIAEAGISPFCVRDVIGVFRTLPIRVGGNSGPTGGQELSWDEVDRRAGRNIFPERTTVTNRVRRIFEFSHDDFHKAMLINQPTILFMTFADYLAPGIFNTQSFEEMSAGGAKIVQDFIDQVEDRHGVAIGWISTSEKPECIISMSEDEYPEGAVV